MKIKRAEKLGHLETPSSESRQIIRDFPRNSRCENTIYGLTSTLCIFSCFCHILLFARTEARSFAMPRAWSAVSSVRHFFNVFMGECQSQAGTLSRPALGIMLPAGLYIDMMRALSDQTVSLSSEPGGESSTQHAQTEYQKNSASSFNVNDNTSIWRANVTGRFLVNRDD
jgi:hypothetical protein